MSHSNPSLTFPLTIVLDSCCDTDIGQPNPRRMPAVPFKQHIVHSIQEAVERTLSYVKTYQLEPCHLVKSELQDINGDAVASVSHDGAVTAQGAGFAG